MLSSKLSKYPNAYPISRYPFCIRIRENWNLVFEKKCGKRCYSNPIPCEFDLFPSIRTSVVDRHVCRVVNYVPAKLADRVTKHHNLSTLNLLQTINSLLFSINNLSKILYGHPNSNELKKCLRPQCKISPKEK
jgi:hypothetical protein